MKKSRSELKGSLLLFRNFNKKSEKFKMYIRAINTVAARIHKVTLGFKDIILKKVIYCHTLYHKK